jgi:hypothetical protein
MSYEFSPGKPQSVPVVAPYTHTSGGRIVT